MNIRWKENPFLYFADYFKIKRIIKSKIFYNFSYLSSAQIISKAIGFLITIYLARILGPSNYGKIGFALVVISYFALISNLGLDMHGTRELARDKKKAPEYLTNIVVIKITASIISYILLLFFLYFLPKTNEIKLLILLFGTSMFINPFSAEWFLQGLENMKWIAYKRMINSISYALLIFFFVRNSGDLYKVCLSNIAAILISVIFLIYQIKEYISLKFFDIKLCKELIKKSLWLFTTIITITIYHGTDILMLGFMSPSEEVGLYRAGYQLSLGGFMVILSLMTYAFFPRMRFDNPTFDRDRKAYTIVAGSYGLILLLFLLIFGKWFFFLIFGANYIGGFPAFFILMLSVIILCFNGPFSQPLFASGYEKSIFHQTLLSAIINIGANFILIPKLAATGAAIAFLLAEAIGFIYIIYLYNNVKTRLSKVRS